MTEEDELEAATKRHPSNLPPPTSNQMNWMYSQSEIPRRESEPVDVEYYSVTQWWFGEHWGRHALGLLACCLVVAALVAGAMARW